MSKVPENANFTSLKASFLRLRAVPPAIRLCITVPLPRRSSSSVDVRNGLPIPGTQLAYAANTDSPVFKYTPTGAYYYLTSGRWFSARLRWWARGPLPPIACLRILRKIPPSSPAGKVLASVPGTPEAEDAVLIAQIPTTSTVNPAEAAKEVKVSYVGEPQFQPITGTTMLYAVNTPNKVIQVGNAYYLCYQGVWFVSFNPQGPWQTDSDACPR